MTRGSQIGRAAAVTALAATAGFGHVVYPAWLLWRTRHLADGVPGHPDPWPGVTVVVPAFREAGVIESKVADLLDNGYPGELEVIVVADDAETATAARRTPATVIAPGSRLGKAEAINRGIGAASQALVVLTDANTALAPASIEALVRWTEDPDIGAVAGRKLVHGGDGEGPYWRFESWLKRREARTGTTVGLVGELCLVRRDLFRPLPADLAVDDLWLALDIVEQGARIVYEPAATTVEEASADLRAEWERRTRVVSGALDVLWRRRELLAPRHGVTAAQLWGHRLIRSSPGPLAHVALFATVATSRKRRPLELLFVVAHAVGVAGLARGARASRLERVAGQVLFLQAVGVGGTVRYLRRDRPARWPKPAR